MRALEDPADDPFTEKVKDFYAHLTALRQMARSAPAEQLLEEIFASTGYLAALGVLSPQYRGSIVTCAVILFVLLGFVAGFASARL